MRSGKKKYTQIKSIELQTLEPRYLLDGAAIATFVDAAFSESVENDIDNAIEVLPAVKQETQLESASELTASYVANDGDVTNDDAVPVSNPSEIVAS